MSRTNFSPKLTALLVLVMLTVTASSARAQTESVLYSFCPQSGCADGREPFAGLVMDAEGSLYGTTYYGGAFEQGAVFKIAAPETETVLYSFCSQPGCADGSGPVADVVFDKKGNLYGTTLNGGANDLGAVFQVAPSGVETVLYSFTGGTSDGSSPYAGLLIDKKGNLYGTTVYGGRAGKGTVFMLTPSKKSGWTETVLYSFGTQGGDGEYPHTSLIMDKEDNLYGTTYNGGANGVGGTVFKLTTSGAETVLYSFCSRQNCADGEGPYAGPLLDKKGTLYGTTYSGGAGGYGTVFELSSTGVETVLYSFTGGDNDGRQPEAGLVMDKKDNLYGCTSAGPGNNLGVLFELLPGKKGTPWSFKTVHAFNEGTGDGTNPIGTPILDTEGDLFGATMSGGQYGFGTVFKVAP